MFVVTQDHIVVLCLIINLYLSWKVYSTQIELDKLTEFSVKSITALAEAIDEIEEYLDDQED